jgi:hypothetical protein
MHTPDLNELARNSSNATIALQEELARLRAIKATKQDRVNLDAILQRLKHPESLCMSDEESNAAHYITIGIMWLGMELKRLGTPTPYPNSMDPSSPKVDPTADGLKL